MIQGNPGFLDKEYDILDETEDLGRILDHFCLDHSTNIWCVCERDREGHTLDGLIVTIL